MYVPCVMHVFQLLIEFRGVASTVSLNACPALLSDTGLQIAYPWLVNNDAGFSFLSVFVHHFTNGLRVIDPIADLVLGIKMLLPIANEVCAYKGGSNCSAHMWMGIIITVASLLDFALGMIGLHDSGRVLGFLGKRMRRVRPSYFN